MWERTVNLYSMLLLPVHALAQVVVGQKMETEVDEMLVADGKRTLLVEKPALAVGEYNLDNMNVHIDFLENEIVDLIVVVAEELILDLTVFRRCSKCKRRSSFLSQNGKYLP